MESNILKAAIYQDDELLAGVVADVLAGMGFDVQICSFTVTEAAAFARTHVCDLSIVDLSLHGFDAYPVIDKLRARRAPFIIITGGEPSEIVEPYASEVLLLKPFSLANLRDAVVRAWENNDHKRGVSPEFFGRPLSRVS